MKNILRDKEGHYVMIKGSIQEEDITVLNIYTPNTGSPQYIRQLLTTLKGQIDNNTILVGDGNTPLTAMDRSSRQRINKETQALNEALDQMDLNRYLLDIPFKSIGIQILLKCTWNIL